MANEPIAERPYMPAYDTEASEAGTLPWSRAVERLQAARNFWLATVRPDGRPHLAPVWCVWHNNALHFSTDPLSRKARNFTLNSNCAVSTDGASASVIIKGVTAIAEAYDVRVLVAEAYAAQVRLADGGD